MKSHLSISITNLKTSPPTPAKSSEKDVKKMPTALFYFARAATYTGQGALNAQGQQQWNFISQNEDESYSNLRVNSSPEALEAYRKSVADPYWLGNLILRPRN